ncbi:MAG: methyltransferase domain-containing protein [Myxococcales bacterium]|nr:methyltransferase domain-containing protein [Myxococcales bacterium]MCB9701731.1 methyltransferase domain-containing protein [Myxococcales bacterium]
MPLIYQEPLDDGSGFQIVLDRIVAARTTAVQEVLIADTSAYGRMLFLDGLIQSASSDEALYHETLIHPALVAHGHPRRVLIGGTGEGATLREVLRHRGVESVITVDIDAEVVALCRELLPEWGAGSLDDPRVEARIEDFAATVASAEAGAFDVIVSDLTGPHDEGPEAALWSPGFFRGIARALADDGVFVCQAGELDPVDLYMTRRVRSTLLEVFPTVEVLYAYVPSFGCMWGFAVASKGPFALCPDDLEARVAGLDLAGLRVYTPLAHRAACALPPFLYSILIEPAAVIDEA